MQIHCPFCQSESFKIHQTNGHACNTIYRCMNSTRCFSERRYTGFAGLRLPPEKITRILNCLVEGVSIRATSRLEDVEKKTVTRIMVHAAERCQAVMDHRLVNLHARYIQADELWCFTGKKEQHCTYDDKHSGDHKGDTWIFLATDADSKLVPSFVVSPDRGIGAAGVTDHIWNIEEILNEGQPEA